MQSKRVDSDRRQGIVLLMVLAAVVLAGVGLTMLARASVRRSLQARAAADRLQTRWGSQTASRVLLDSAAEVFVRLDEQRRLGAPVPTGPIRAQFQLGTHTFDVVLADEDAKVNLNAVYHEGGPDAVAQAVQALVGPLVQPLLSVDPQTESMARRRARTAGQESGGESDDGDFDPVEDAIEPPAAFATWADVVDVDRLRLATGDARVLAELSSQLTLRGSGRLNARRATDEAIRTTLQTVLTDGLAGRVVDRIRESPTAQIELVLRLVVKDARDRRRLERLIGQQSGSYSVWVESSSPRGRSQSYAVRRLTADGEIESFGLSL